MSPTSRIPRARAEGLIIQEADRELLIYDARSEKAVCLNPTAALVWRSCDGKLTIEDLAAALGEELSVGTGREELVRVALEQLRSADLLDDGRVQADAEPISRRSLITRFGVPAASIPLVMSLAVPSAAGAQSCSPIESPCSVPEDCCDFPGISCTGGVCSD